MNARLRASLRGTPRKDQPILEQVNHGNKPHQDQDQQARADNQDRSPARSVSPGGHSSRASSRSLSSSHTQNPFRGATFHQTRARVNTPPRLKSCGFWASPPIGELGAQGAIPPPLEDDDRGVVVPIEGHAATALDPAIRERKMLEDCTAARAGLGRVGWIDLDHLATGAFSLVREMGDEVGPASIQDAHGEAAVRHGGDTEVFEHDPIEPRDQFVDELVEEVFPRVGHMDHQALQSQDQPTAVPAAGHAPGDLSLKDAQLLEDLAIPARVFLLLPVAERGESQETQVDADRFPGLRQRFRLLDRAGKGDEPLAGPAKHAGRLDRPFDPAMPADGNPADAGEVQATAIDLEAVAVLLEAEPRESVPGLEPGVAGILAGLDSAKERLE